MSSESSSIVCRRCGESFPVEDRSCPHCGKSVRNSTYLAIVVALGLVMAVASLFNLGQLAVFGVVGALLAVAGGYLLYNKRQRVREASEVDLSEEIGESGGL